MFKWLKERMCQGMHSNCSHQSPNNEPLKSDTITKNICYLCFEGIGKILRCPFCGKYPILMIEAGYMGSLYMKIGCDNCDIKKYKSIDSFKIHTEGRNKNNIIDAVVGILKEWNKRP